jgi:hypothetical protein
MLAVETSWGRSIGLNLNGKIPPCIDCFAAIAAIENQAVIVRFCLNNGHSGTLGAFGHMPVSGTQVCRRITLSDGATAASPSGVNLSIW